MSQITLIAPDHWASYLINDDASGLTPEDKAAADSWLEREGVLHVLSIEGEPFFNKHLRLHAPEAKCEAGSVLEYVCELRETRFQS